MASRKRKNSRKQLWLGLLAVAVCMAVLLLVLTAPEPGSFTASETTAGPETTLGANPYDPRDFQFDGEYLTYLAGDSRLGIDVSSHQGEIDWQKVSDAGVEFVMVRLGYRGYESGELNIDEKALLNLAGARAAGLDVGAYFFSQAVNVAEAREEAEFVLRLLDGMALEMPVVYDWEFVSSEARTGSVDDTTLTACTETFCQVIENAGYEPMVYFNWHQGQHMLSLEELTEYEFWLAMYDTQLDFPYKIRMWQYTETGTVPGIAGNVDINLWLP